MKKKKDKLKNMDSHAKSSTISRFTVVVVTFFFKILDDFHDFVSECVSFSGKINNPFWCVTFFKGKVAIFIGRERKIHIFPTKIDEKKIAKVSPSNNNYSFRII